MLHMHNFYPVMNNRSVTNGRLAPSQRRIRNTPNPNREPEASWMQSSTF